MSPEWDSNGKINLTPTAPNMPSDPGKTLGAENAIRYQVNGAPLILEKSMLLKLLRQ